MRWSRIVLTFLVPAACIFALTACLSYVGKEGLMLKTGSAANAGAVAARAEDPKGGVDTGPGFLGNLLSGLLDTLKGPVGVGAVALLAGHEVGKRRERSKAKAAAKPAAPPAP